jgi:tetratricopeptide (TPR) repeat protein
MRGFRPGWLLSVVLISLPVLVPRVVALASEPPGGLTAQQLLAQGDQRYAQGRLDEAREAYLAVLRWKPGTFTALTRAARTESDMGEDAEGETQKRLIEAAVEHARAAVQVAPESAQGHVWLAVALGRQAFKEGPKRRLALSREIKGEVDAALAIDPLIGRAYHVRAIWNRKIASLSGIERVMANAVLGGVPKGASMENAVHDLEKAIELEPNYVNHHLELGRTFYQLKRYDAAQRELEKAVALPPTSHPRDPKLQAEARELLSKIAKRG